jgi:hypothetical protein
MGSKFGRNAEIIEPDTLRVETQEKLQATNGNYHVPDRSKKHALFAK